MNYWLNITSGRGPEECCRAVYLALKKLEEQAKAKKVKLTVLDAVPSSQKDCFKSVLLGVDDYDGTFGLDWEGTIQWTCPSPFRPNHKRKNWFVGVELIRPLSTMSFDVSDIRIETTKASGPGGQHVNKTESAIRAIHLPTGLSVTASQERCQHMNKKLALAKLKLLIDNQNDTKQEAKEQEIWSTHNQLERGNPVRRFIGPTFREIR